MKPIANRATIVASTEPGDVGRTGTIKTRFVRQPNGKLDLVQRWVPNPSQDLTVDNVEIGDPHA